jgi:cytochrome P450
MADDLLAAMADRLLRQFPRIALAGEPVRRDTLLLRGFDALPVTVR